MSERGRTFLLQGQGDVTTNTAVGGTTNTVAKFTGAFTIGDSSITDNGTTVTINPSTSTVIQVGSTTVGTVAVGGLTLSRAIAAGTDNYLLTLNNPTTNSDVRVGLRMFVNAALSAGATIKAVNDNASGADVIFTAINSGAETSYLILDSSANTFRPITDDTIILGDGTRGFKQFHAAYSDTSGGVTGNRTINKMAGSVNFAGGMTTLVVTNSVVTTSSKVFASVSTSGSTGVIGSIVPANGSFAINMATAPGAETRVQWFVLSAN